MKEKLIIILGFGVSFAVIITLIIFLRALRSPDIWALVEIAGVLILVGASTWLMYKKAKAQKKGLAISDELAKKVSYKAGFYTYMCTIWISVIALWYNGPISQEILHTAQLSVEQLVGIIVLLSGIIFFGLFFYFNQKGDA